MKAPPIDNSEIFLRRDWVNMASRKTWDTDLDQLIHKSSLDVDANCSCVALSIIIQQGFAENQSRTDAWGIGLNNR
jgi:hypothetical protein